MLRFNLCKWSTKFYEVKPHLPSVNINLESNTLIPINLKFNFIIELMQILLVLNSVSICL